MHKPIILRALRAAQTPTRFEHLTPALRGAICGALSEFETILSVRLEKSLPTESVMDDLGGVLAVIFVIETLGEPGDNRPMIDSIQRQVDRAKASLTTALKPPAEKRAKPLARQEQPNIGGAGSSAVSTPSNIGGAAGH